MGEPDQVVGDGRGDGANQWVGHMHHNTGPLQFGEVVELLGRRLEGGPVGLPGL